MPHVGEKTYSYSRKGIAAAKRAAQRTGKPMVMRKMPNGKMMKGKMPKGM